MKLQSKQSNFISKLCGSWSNLMLGANVMMQEFNLQIFLYKKINNLYDLILNHISNTVS